MSDRRFRPSHAALRQQGLSLVELMVAMGVGLMVIAVTSLLFAQTSRARTEMLKSSRMVDNARHAQDLLAEELRLAGFWGDLPIFSGQEATDPDPCAADPALLGWSAQDPARIPLAVRGIDVTEPAPECVPNRLAGTDLLVLRRVSTRAETVAGRTAGSAYIQTSRCDLDQRLFSLSATTADFGLRNRNCAGQAPVRRFYVRIYYVASCNRCASPSDGIPTLKRVEIDGARQTVSALAEGIEDLQFDFGFDANGDAVVDTFLLKPDPSSPTPALRDWTNVIAVRVNLLARSTEPAADPPGARTFPMGLHGVRQFGADERWKRTGLTTTVRLLNVAGRRE